MATEQLVELFAVEPSKMHNSTKSISSSSSQKPSKKKNRRNAQSDMDQKFDLEELWDQSQVFVFISFFLWFTLIFVLHVNYDRSFIANVNCSMIALML